MSMIEKNRSLKWLYDGLTDDSLRVALFAGLATVPFTLLLSGVAVSDSTASVSISGTPLFLAGLLVGYYYSDRETESSRAGTWTGLAGSIAVIVATAISVATAIGAGSRAATIAVVVGPIFAALGVAVSVLVASIGAGIGGWVTTRLGRDRRVADEVVDPPSSKWLRFIAGYAFVAPAVFSYMLWGSPESGVGFVLTFLSLLGLVVLSIVAFVGLFIEVTAPRTDWLPTIWLYVGAPFGVAAIVYAEATVRGSIYPTGDAMYGFFGGLWLTAVGYLFQRWRHTG